MILQNVAKRSENQAAQKCSICYCVICEKGGFEALRFIFSESMCLDVPSYSVPWQPPTSGVEKNLATQKRFTLFCFECIIQ